VARASGSLRAVKVRGGIAIVLATFVVASLATSASAAATRSEYVAQVDHVCSAARPQLKAAQRKIARIAKSIGSVALKVPVTGASTKAVLRKLNRLSKSLARVGRSSTVVWSTMVEGIATIPAAAGDEGAVAQWVAGLRQYLGLLAASNRAAKHGKLLRSLSLIDQAQKALDFGGGAVQGFGIAVCPTSSIGPFP
jgi:hypothetical protein